MAGRNIKGITVEIGGDTTKLQTALEGVNSKIKNTQAQLRDVEKLLKLDPGNTELLAQKHKLLADAVSETKSKLETLETAAKQANDALAKGEISKEQYDALQREIVEAKEESETDIRFPRWHDAGRILAGAFAPGFMDAGNAGGGIKKKEREIS
jgi:phage-related minor tail protein